MNAVFNPFLNQTQDLSVEINYVDKKVEELSMRYGSEGAAALDCYAVLSEPLTIYPGGEAHLVGLGFRLNIKNRGIAANLLPRSGLGHKGIVLGNLVGLIDSDYQGEVKASVWNRGHTQFTINPYDRICQMLFVPVLHPTLVVVEQFDQLSNRGASGFGSTGTSQN